MQNAFQILSEPGQGPAEGFHIAFGNAVRQSGGKGFLQPCGLPRSPAVPFPYRQAAFSGGRSRIPPAPAALH